LAILGMFTAHLGNPADARLWNGASWLEAADGRPAATFALLAGVSAGFISGGAAPVAGSMSHSRVRILVRAAVLFPLGVLLAALGTRIAVILPSYAVMFAMLTVALAWRPRRLLLAAGVVLMVAPPLVYLAREGLPYPGPLGYPAELLVGEFYPALVWIAYLLVGLALARLDLTAPAMPRRLLLCGLPLAALGYTAGAVAVRIIPREHTLRLALLDAAPHADSAVEVVGSIGVVLCVLAVCLVVASRAPAWLYPLTATGALALTAYSVQIVAIAWLGEDVFVRPSNLRLAAFIVVTLAAAALWRRRLGRGPLEAALHHASASVADRLVPAGASPRGAVLADDGRGDAGASEGQPTDAERDTRPR
jgi:uncharacterized membrane protein YeiB